MRQWLRSPDAVLALGTWISQGLWSHFDAYIWCVIVDDLNQSMCILLQVTQFLPVDAGALPPVWAYATNTAAMQDDDGDELSVCFAVEAHHHAL